MHFKLVFLTMAILLVNVPVTSTEIGQVAVALLVLFTALANRKKVNEVHVLVNSQMKTALDRVSALEHALNLNPGEPITQTISTAKKSES